MQNIEVLHNIGVGKRCLLIGGGHSVKGFDFKRVPKDCIVIEINFPHITDCHVDYSLYYDCDVKAFWNDNKVNYLDRRIIGFITHKGASDYTYRYDQIVFGDSGFHGVQIADSVMNFSEIYLIGYDYRTTEKSYHYYESESNDDKINRFKKWSIGIVKDRYNVYPFKNKVYQCTKDTDLTIFPYKPLCQ